jgi:hypothetical protein
MTHTASSKACLAAVAHFAAHAAALKTQIDLKAEAESVGRKLEAEGLAEKPNFSKVSDLHFRRQHIADRLLKATNEIARLEKDYEPAGNALYHETLRLRRLAADAAVECARARLAQDFTGDALEFVLRWHPVTITEEGRDTFVHAPRDCGSFPAFALIVPELLKQIELSRQRIQIYERCTESRALPDQAKLDSLTPEAAKPVYVAPRRELTDAEQRERDLSLASEDLVRLRRLHAEAKKIAGDFGENIEQLMAFVHKHPELAPYFPQRRVAA